jgi:hypothetical protein
MLELITSYMGFSVVSNGELSISAARRCFLLAFNTLFLSSMHHSKAIFIYSIVTYGGMLISTDEGRVKSEMTSSFAIAVMDFPIRVP